MVDATGNQSCQLPVTPVLSPDRKSCADAVLLMLLNPSFCALGVPANRFPNRSTTGFLSVYNASACSASKSNTEGNS